MKKQWKPESFQELNRLWNLFWHNVKFDKQLVNDIRLESYQQAVRSVYANGDMILKCFEIPYDVVIDYYMDTLPQYIDKTTFFVNLFLSESIKESIPEFKLEDGLLYIPEFKLDEDLHEKDSIIKVFKDILVNGGSYKRFEGSDEITDILVKDFCNGIFEENHNNILVFSCHECWNDWFYDVAWDYSWIIINKNNFKLWVIAITDTD